LEWDWEELELVVDQAEEDKREEGEKETELAREVAESAGESRSVWMARVKVDSGDGEEEDSEGVGSRSKGSGNSVLTASGLGVGGKVGLLLRWAPLRRPSSLFPGDSSVIYLCVPMGTRRKTTSSRPAYLGVRLTLSKHVIRSDVHNAGNTQI
jgi:hypothetical protein